MTRMVYVEGIAYAFDDPVHCPFNISGFSEIGDKSVCQHPDHDRSENDIRCTDNFLELTSFPPHCKAKLYVKGIEAIIEVRWREGYNWVKKQ